MNKIIKEQKIPKSGASILAGATTHSTRHALKIWGMIYIFGTIPAPVDSLRAKLLFCSPTYITLDLYRYISYTHTLYISNVHTYYLTKWIIGIQKNDDFPVQNRYLLIHRTLFEYMQNHPSIDRSGESCLIFLVDLRGTCNLPAIVPYLETRNPCNRTALVQTLLFSLLSFLFPPSSMDQ